MPAAPNGRLRTPESRLRSGFTDRPTLWRELEHGQHFGQSQQCVLWERGDRVVGARIDVDRVAHGRVRPVSLGQAELGLQLDYRPTAPRGAATSYLPVSPFGHELSV